MILEQYIAEVKTNDKDPDKEFGIQVRCDALDTEGGILPIYFKPLFPPNLVKVPDVGTLVKICMIANGEDGGEEYLGSVDFPNFAYYDHRILDKTTTGKMPSDFLTNYPKRCGYWLSDGSLFYFDETKNKKEFLLKLTDGKNFIQITESKITIDQNGTKIELENGTMTTTVNTSKLGASGAAEAVLKGTTAAADLATFFSIWIPATSALGASIDPAVVAYANTMNAAVNTLATSVANTWKSTKHFVDQ